jgi:hypothetical protein
MFGLTCPPQDLDLASAIGDCLDRRIEGRRANLRRQGDHMNVKKALAIGAGLLCSCNSFAGVYCTEGIYAAIVHADGSVFFRTTETCPGWCQVNWGTDLKNNRGYAMLLTAKTTGIDVEIFWPNLTSCSQDNPTFASPDSIELR